MTLRRAKHRLHSRARLLLSIFITGVLFALTASAARAADPSLPNGTVDIRMEPGQGSSGWITTKAPVFVQIPRMTASFVASEDDTSLTVTFSAEASTSVSNKRVFVRALVDGEVAAPADVVFTEGTFGGARSFTFTHVVQPGIHTVEMQWCVDSGATASLRAASLLLRHGVTDSPDGTLTFHTPESGASDRTDSGAWAPVPEMTVVFFAPEGAEPIVSFSAETYVSGSNKRMFARALIDGALLSPGNVVFARRASRQTHHMSFKGPALAEGLHTATIEWLVDAGGIASVGDRTITVSAFPQGPALTHHLVVPPSGPSISTSSGTWAPVPGLSTLVSPPENGELAVSFSGEVQSTTSAQLEMRLVANGVAVAGETAVLTLLGQPFETQSFSFDRKHLFLSQNTITGLQLEWRAIGGTVSMGDRAMEVIAEKGLVPDLAEAPEIGVGNGRVEAAIGTRQVLTIIHRIPRAAPNDTIPSVAGVTAALYGAEGMADYYDKVSGGRFGLTNAGVLSYDALESESHYWNHAPFGCGLPASDGFGGGHAERWAESITLADPDVDFAAFDDDKDGIVSPNELAILIIAPQAVPGGFTRALAPYCDATLPFVVDGVIIPSISEWFTDSPANDWEVATHELAHLILGLGDMYVNGFNFDTEVGGLSLMGDSTGTTSHIDPMNKLALGWVTPVYATVDGSYSIGDVKESGVVLALPREADGDGKELFLLENRRSSGDNPLYDEDIGANGMVAWHIVEDPVQSAAPPACMTVADWGMVSSNARRGIRVLRPGVDIASGSLSDWDATAYDLEDSGLTCPGALPIRNALLWADGSPSGWGVLDFSAPGPVMTFDVEAP